MMAKIAGKYFIQIDKNRIGPLTLEELVALELPSKIKIWDENLGQFVTLKELTEKADIPYTSMEAELFHGNVKSSDSDFNSNIYSELRDKLIKESNFYKIVAIVTLLAIMTISIAGVGAFIFADRFSYVVNEKSDEINKKNANMVLPPIKNNTNHILIDSVKMKIDTLANLIRVK